jgi:cyclomaltodextrinase / maltogenic alpha-amylase / neopullulanase
MSTPYWVQDAIFYQIFPDRFSNGNPDNDPPNVQPWGSPPQLNEFQGGDLRGIIQHFDYLLDLGINAIYLNPIFEATSTHRYNTTDYYKIDPKLGDMQDFCALLDTAHRNNVRVILDGVFNHCGRGFFAFNDVLENGEKSPYASWFHINKHPVDAYGEGGAQNYSAWWNFKSLPKFNTDNPEVRKYLLGVARYWIEKGIDGWRLDVPNEINDDDFWAEFRYIVKSVNRDAYILGEVWTPDPRWANDGHCDGLINYPIRDALLTCFSGQENVNQFAERVEGLFQVYAHENINAMYLPLGSHDTERLKTAMGGNMAKVKLAILFQMAYPGAPAIYYGDEIGMEGGKDPDCRRAFPWNPDMWDVELRHWVKNLISLRRRMPSLRRGEYTRIMADTNLGLYAFARSIGNERVVVAMNASGHAHSFEIDAAGQGWQEGREVQNLIDYRRYRVKNGRLSMSLSAWSGAWLE